MNTDIHTLAGAYALNALTELERAEFARHAASCASCRVELAELQEAANRLADVTATAPPARLRTQVLDQIGQTRQAGPGRGGPAGTGTTGTATGRRWLRRAATAVAAAVLAAGAGTAGYVLHDRPADRGTSARASATLAVLAAPDARLTSKSVAGARVTVVISDTLNEGVAVLQSLPYPGAQAYQLWLIRGTGATSVGVLAAGATGATRLFTGVRGADQFGISRGPAQRLATPPSTLMTNFALS